MVDNLPEKAEPKFTTDEYHHYSNKYNELWQKYFHPERCPVKKKVQANIIRPPQTSEQGRVYAGVALGT
jgi:hypothetical protein